MKFTDTELDLFLGRDLGKTGDYYIENEDGDRFPVEVGVTIRAMFLKALSMKWRVGKEYLVLEARTTKIKFTTVGKDGLKDQDLEQMPEVIGAKSAKGQMILQQAEKILGPLREK